MDFDMFEHQYSDGIPEELQIEELSKNAEKIDAVLLNMCTDPSGFKPEQFIDSLDLDKLSNKHKAWLLIKYGTILREEIHRATEEGNIAEPEAKLIIETLETLEETLRIKARIPKNLTHIHEINSIIAVGPKEIRKETILNHRDDRRHQKIAKIT